MYIYEAPMNLRRLTGVLPHIPFVLKHFPIIFVYSFAARQFTVRLGDIDLSTDREPSSPVTFKVTEVRAHPRFSRVGFYNDIAVLVLDRPVRKSKYVIPVCLPQPNQLPSKDRLAGLLGRCVFRESYDNNKKIYF